MIIDTIYNRIENEISVLLSDKGYHIYIEQSNSEIDTIKYTIWWNEQEKRSVLLCWHPSSHEFELCRSFKKGKPKLKGFSWEQVYDDAYTPGVIAKLEEKDINSIVSYFMGELEYSLKRRAGSKPPSKKLARFDKKKLFLRRGVLTTSITLLFIPLVVLGIKNGKSISKQSEIRYQYTFPYKQLINKNTQANKTATTDSTIN